jgi:hypothetical protein
MVVMSPKSSVPQSDNSVSQALMPDIRFDSKRAVRNADGGDDWADRREHFLKGMPQFIPSRTEISSNEIKFEKYYNHNSVPCPDHDQMTRERVPQSIVDGFGGTPYGN